jgi:hypothetical protein
VTLPLSKAYDPADLAQLQRELTIVDLVGIDGQHPSRRWEYALALHAQATWTQKTLRQGGPIVDVGGAGSTFWKMVGGAPVVVDPREGPDLAHFVVEGARLAQQVFCLSVLEHVDDLDRFVYHLGCLVAPGGLLVLTMDYAPEEGPDIYHWHWMRQRIFTPQLIWWLMAQLEHDHLTIFGEVEYTWHGPIDTWGYAPASLILTKRP